LLLNAFEKPVCEIMVRKLIAIPRTATVLDACEFFTLHRLLTFPVVDEDCRLLGVVDVERYTDGHGDAADLLHPGPGAATRILTRHNICTG
jgi:magnesium transporter